MKPSSSSSSSAAVDEEQRRRRRKEKAADEDIYAEHDDTKMGNLIFSLKRKNAPLTTDDWVKRIAAAIPNLRDMSVSSAHEQMVPYTIFRSARPFSKSALELSEILEFLGIQMIIDLRDDHLTAIDVEETSRRVISEICNVSHVTQELSKGLGLSENEFYRKFASPTKLTRLNIVNVMDSPEVRQQVKKRLSENALTLNAVQKEPLMVPTLVAAKLADSWMKNTTAYAPFYFCKYIISKYSLTESYIEMLQCCGNNFSVALKLIALTQGAVLFHCSLGKDRTGLLAMLILIICGASDDRILFDYSLTDFQEHNGFEEYKRKFIVDLSGLGEDFVGARPECIKETLNYLRSEYGSPPDKYFDKIQFDAIWRDRLRAKLMLNK